MNTSLLHYPKADELAATAFSISYTEQEFLDIYLNNTTYWNVAQITINS